MWTITVYFPINFPDTGASDKIQFMNDHEAVKFVAGVLSSVDCHITFSRKLQLIKIYLS